MSGLHHPAVSAACACGRLRRASRALTQLYDDLMAPAGLRVTQFSLLRTLSREGPIADHGARGGAAARPHGTVAQSRPAR